MLYREPDSRRSLRRGRGRGLGGVGPGAARRRRTETDLRELSPDLQHDLGLRDRGDPY